MTPGPQGSLAAEVRSPQDGLDTRGTPRSNGLTTDGLTTIGLTTIGLIALSVALVFARSWGVLAPDGHFVFMWNPAGELARYSELWTRNADLGGVVPTFAPVPYAFMSGLRALGLEPWVVQRVWCAALLAAASTGTAIFTRALAPQLRAAPFVAGVAMIVAPFTVGFFLPTWLYINAATLPWLCVLLWQGITTEHRWRAAAGFAVIATIGSAWNPPGAVWAGLSLVPVMAYALLSGRSTRRSTFGWMWRTCVLAAPIVPVILLRVTRSSAVLEENLASSESAAAVSRSSSWSESLRGLGSWRLYWNPRGPLNFRYIETYLTSAPVVIASFVGILIAFVAVVRLRGGARLMLGTMMLLAAMVMVGGYPLSDQSLFGRLLFSLYDASQTAFSMRSVYKAGAGLALGVSVLVGLGVSTWLERAGRRSFRVMGSIALVAVAVLTATPWLEGSLWRSSGSLRGDIPTYWSQAGRWLDDQPSESAALVLPATPNYEYRWGGAPNGDIFPSLIERPVMAAKPLSLTPELQYGTIQAMTDAVSSGRYRAGTIGPIARRLGVRYIVVRNDLAWDTSGVPRPSDLDDLRRDRDLVLVTTFGDPGENTVDATDTSPEARADAALPPVEIYEVRDANEPVRATEASPPILLSGDGAGWTTLARHGDLDGTGPIRYAAQLDTEDLTTSIEAGSPLVITDTNRRRLVSWGSQPLTLTADDDARVADAFGVEGSQSTVTFGAASAIEEVGTNQLLKPSASHRPSAAFDRSPTTTWLTGLLTPPGQEALEVTFVRPERVGSVTVQIADVPGGRTVTSIAVYVGDDTPQLASVVDGVASVEIDPVDVPWVRIQIAGVTGSGDGPYGFAEVSIDDLDLRERVVLPDHVERAASTDSALRGALAGAAVSYSFERVRSSYGDIEPLIARRFEVMTPLVGPLVGSLEADRAMSDQTLSSLLGLPFEIATTNRLRGAPSNGGTQAVDGDVTTAWTPGAVDVATLQIAYDTATQARPTHLDFDVSDGHALPQRITVRSDQGSTSRLIDPNDCQMFADICRLDFRFDRSRERTFVAIDLVLPNVDDPVSLTEVSFGRSPNVVPVGVSGCRPDLVEIDGRPVDMRLVATAEGLVAGEPVRVSSCGDVSLGIGTHELFTTSSSSIDDLLLGRTPREAITTPSATLDVASDRHGATAYDIALPPHDTDALLFLGQAENDSWSANRNGASLGAPVMLDGQAAWVVPSANDSESVTVSYGPQRLYEVLYIVLAVGVLAALAVMIIDPRRAEVRDRTTPRRHLAAWLASGVAVAVVVLIGGPIDVAVALLVLLGIHRRWFSPRAVGTIAVALVVLAVLATLPILGPSLTPANPFWPGRRELAHTAARSAAVLLWLAIAGWVRFGDPPETSRWPMVRWPSLRSSTPRHRHHAARSQHDELVELFSLEDDGDRRLRTGAGSSSSGSDA